MILFRYKANREVVNFCCNCKCYGHFFDSTFNAMNTFAIVKPLFFYRLNKVMSVDFLHSLYMRYIRNMESFLEYYEMIISVRAWSNPIKPEDQIKLKNIHNALVFRSPLVMQVYQIHNVKLLKIGLWTRPHLLLEKKSISCTPTPIARINLSTITAFLYKRGELTLVINVITEKYILIKKNIKREYTQDEQNHNLTLRNTVHSY